MEIRNPAYRQAVAELFAAAPFIGELGIEALEIAPGRVEARLVVAPRHLQQNGFIHAGVQATLADHTAGAAACSVIGADQLVLTSNFTIHLLTAAQGEELRARAAVIKAGRRLVVAEANVFALRGGSEQLVARAMVTLAVLPRGGGEMGHPGRDSHQPPSRGQRLP